MKVIVVYLGQGSLNNFAHSIQSGVWGFKNKGQPTETFGPGDTIFFASGYTGTNIRIPEQEWLTHSIGLVATAEIVSPLRSGGHSPLARRNREEGGCLSEAVQFQEPTAQRWQICVG